MKLDKYLTIIILAFILSRILIFVTASFALTLDEGPIFYEVTENKFLNAFSQYDSAAYIDIAENGYTDSNDKYFFTKGTYQWWPAYPLGVKVASYLLFENIPLAAFLVSNIFLVFAIYFIHKLFTLKFSKKNSMIALSIMLFFPTSYFLSASYSESLFILTASLGFYFAYKKEWLYANLAAGVCTLTRAYAFLIFPVLLLMYFKDKEYKIKKIDLKILTFSIIPIVLFGFMTYLYFTAGSPFKFMDHSQTGRGFSYPLHGLFAALIGIFSGTAKYSFYHIFNAAILISFIFLIYRLKKHNFDMFLYTALIMFLVVSQNTIEGISRYIFSLFPCFIAIPLLLKDFKFRNIIYSLYFIFSSLLLIILTVWHTRGGLFILG